MFDCKILADSISDRGHRLTTFQITYPYIIHAEIMTHRMFSRNTQSSRATPVMKNVERVKEGGFYPETFRRNIKGMADGEAMKDYDLQRAMLTWKLAMADAVKHAEAMAQLEVHKALSNRVLGPYQWWTMILTATDFSNFFALRCHPEAQQEIRTIAEMMKEQYDSHKPTHRHLLWHLPLVTPEEISDEDLSPMYWTKVAIGRCARVSYLTHDGRRDPEADVALYERLLQNGHMSPFEHVARPFRPLEWITIQETQAALRGSWLAKCQASDRFKDYHHNRLEYAGNLHGWWSARMDVPFEHDYNQVLLQD